MQNGFQGFTSMKKRTSAAIFAFKNHTFLKNVFYKIFCKKDVSISSPDIQNKEAKHLFNYKYDCNNPKTFNEYLGWIKFNYTNELWAKCADKLGAKHFLSKLNLQKYTPKTLAIYNDTTEINLEELPNEFVLKTNHDSGTVFVCNKKTTNFDRVFSKLNESIKHNYSQNGEWVYSKIKPQIFAEELIVPVHANEELVDYKFFIYNGIFKWGFTAQNREKDCRFCVFEKNFTIQNVDYIYLRPSKKDLPNKPPHFDEMVKIAELIGKNFWFVRVDFYETNSGPVIGELTFFSQSGLGPFTDKKFDYKYGRLFETTPFFPLIIKSK